MGFKFWKKKEAAVSQRSFEAAELADRIVGMWRAVDSDYNEEVKGSLATIRARARDLVNNNDYACRYITVMLTSVIGNKGIRLSSVVKKLSKRRELDSNLNEDIEWHWKVWGEKGSCEVTGRMSWLEVQKVALSCLIRDGEVFIKLVKNADNKYSFSLQLIDPGLVDEGLVLDLKDGNNVRMGIELNKYNRPVGYWLKTEDKPDVYQKNVGYKRYPASEIIHLYRSKRPDAIRDVSWLTPSMRRLKMLSAYEEAETTAARVSASKSFVVTEKLEAYGSGFKGEAKAKKMPELSMKPGSGFKIPAGMDIKTIDPTHPNGNYSEFSKSQLRAISAGWNVSYHSLTGDLTAVNYSSIRQGALSEREEWRSVQSFLVESFHTVVYREWLSQAILTKAKTGFPVSAVMERRCLYPSWIPKSYPWIDPLKDIKAAIMAEEAGIRSKSQTCAEQGVDFDDVCEQRKREKETLEKLGLDSVTLSSNGQPVGGTLEDTV